MATTALDLDRRLTDVDPRRVPRYLFDVLIVGGGAAGAAAALSAARSGASVAVLCKKDLLESNTRYAQGGMAAVLAEHDTFEEHIADTIRVGCGLSEPDSVEAVIRGGPEAVRLLLDCGASLDRREDGSLHLMREGGHGHHRIVHAKGDTTGVEIQRALSESVENNERITIFPDTFVVELLSNDDSEEVFGCLVRDARGEHVAFHANHVILATGGAGQVFRETTNPVLATGDGVALAFRAGATLRDMEFFQFHPTCLYIAGAARVLISEIVRGAGGVLRDKSGDRFMPSYHSDAELAPRDVVSRAVFRRMVESGDTNVYLDLSEVEGDPHKLFPHISRVCNLFEIDIARDPVPVRPGAHYMIGGVKVDLSGRTNVPGLLAAGECASTGVHGANRMGSNSLLEALVLGTRAGFCAAAEKHPVAARSWTAGTGRKSDGGSGVQVNIEDVTYSLKSLMWREMGIEREASQMLEALSKINLWSRAVSQFAPAEPRTWQLENMLLVSRLATVGALARTESRGVHHRTDYATSDSKWCAHTELLPRLNGDVLEAVEVKRSELVEDSSPRRQKGAISIN
ncbi:MAG: L-aspartate oxidase [Planctomycetota bacterium]|jgi:L-aspartate oxidase